MNELQNGSRDETAIRALVEDWAGAVRNRDFDAILRHHDTDILMFDVPPPFQSNGIDAYRNTWDLFFSCAPDPAVFDIKEMSIVAGTDVGFVIAAMQCVGGAPEREELNFRLTIGLRKIDGQWTVVHEHHSVPAL
ncbi:MAG TPA: nuclear transport factor 2 family protein [Aliidongia sp.]|uniref:YybH family protein n=1 Tax=Aliidongia sp. TaxID=1914230 RepID=UPI002DDD0977|nr:nuclear transport factor 2 family protein [Aliidongia sp.]HEV2674788.1 nuclear transport factor 2 family protein [Aliidongia sp.]